MNPMQQKVHDFLLKHLGRDETGWPNKTGIYNKWLLIKEEYEELESELIYIELLDPQTGEHRQLPFPEGEIDEPSTVDAICDLLYVVFNLCEELHIDIEPFFNEVHRSNMTKVPAALSPNKKVLKGPDFEPPRIAELLGLARAEKTQALHERMTDSTRVFYDPRDTHEA